MPTDPSHAFQSVLSACLEKFLQEKHACGYDYHEPTRILRHLDNFLVREGLTTYELPSSVARKWLAKKAHEPTGNELPPLGNSPGFCCGLAIRRMCPIPP